MPLPRRKEIISKMVGSALREFYSPDIETVLFVLNFFNNLLMDTSLLLEKYTELERRGIL